jgi:MIF4G domain
MSIASPIQLTYTYEQFMNYRETNIEMIPVVQEYYEANKNKFQKTNNNGWRKFDQKNNDNWLIAKKFSQNDEEKLYSHFMGLLNKLTDSNFDELAKELINLEITKQAQLIKLAEFIFNKAIGEIKFSQTYAKLAKELASYYVKENDKNIYFRELLINKCQMMFNDCVSFDPILDNKTLVTKEVAIGCMIFIGELYNSELLTSKIVNSCFLLLLMKSGQNKPYIIDCICILMKTTGKIFSEKCPNESNIIFDRLEKLAHTGTLSNKDKFAVMDLFDMFHIALSANEMTK